MYKFLKLTSVFMLALVVNVVKAQSNEQILTNEPISKEFRAENFVISLMKDIEHISDTTHKHHHEPHKSSFKIIHFNFDLMAKEGVKLPNGAKTVMLKMIDPQGTEIFDPIAGGGYFMMNGKESSYSMKKEFMYTGKTEHIELLYNHPKKFHKGLHLVEVFIDGKKVGEEHFVIK